MYNDSGATAMEIAKYNKSWRVVNELQRAGAR